MRLTRQALRHLETILAIEALIAVESLGVWEPQLGVDTRAAYAAVRAANQQCGILPSASATVEAVRAALRT
ncbi:MAG: hypothetical protein PVSMB4_15130 [Ktedonobacterales bacterium]